MHVRRYALLVTCALPLFATFVFGTGCQQPNNGDAEVKVAQYEQRMEAEVPIEPAPGLTELTGRPPADLQGDVSYDQPQSLDSIIWLGLADPTVAESAVEERLRVARFSDRVRRDYEDQIYPRALELVKEIQRPKQFRLSLDEALRRALVYNYAIKVDGYAPAISTAQIVQAEAAFDLAFFANVSRDNTDQPTPSQLLASQTDTTIVSGGIAKLLASGGTVTLTQSMVRVDNPGFQFNILNPAWTQRFQAELRQPLLRNFGIDFNRSQINIRKNEKKINEEQFRASVIDILVNVEQAYWNLVAARRDVTITAELLAQAEQTLSRVEARQDFDAYQTLVYRSRSNLEGRRFEYIDVKNRVRDAEDALLNLLNDPDLPLSADYEIVPADNPTTVEVVRDRFHTIETALKRRPEIIQSRRTVDNTRIQLGIAKNQALPQLDVIYRMTVTGLGSNADNSFDQLSSGDFVDQFVGVEFRWNFGERAERAGIRVARLQQSQAVLNYKRALDDVITDCRVALRGLITNYEQLFPSYQGVIAAAENLRSLQERQESMSPAQLDTIFTAQTNLAQARRALLQSLVSYNQGIVDVERAKGTLLEYNNVMLAEQP